MLEPHTSLHREHFPRRGGWITAADHSAVVTCQNAGHHESGSHGSPARLRLRKALAEVRHPHVKF